MIVWVPCVLIGVWATTGLLPPKPPIPTLPNGVVNQNAILPFMVKVLTDPLLGGFVSIGILAAIMSTADSQLLVAASGVTRDLYEKVFGGTLSRRGMLWLSRGVVLVLGISAMILAASGTKKIFSFVLYAWAILGGSFSPAILLSLYWKRLTRPGLVSGMLMGAITTVVWKEWIRPSFNLYELVPAFFFSLIATILVSLVTRPPEDAAERMGR